MAEQNKKPAIAIWATFAVVALLFVYPLTLGPACWLAGNSETARSAILSMYYPLLRLAKATRHEVRPGLCELGWGDNCIKWYATRGRKDGEWPIVVSSGDTAWATSPDPEPAP